jgi:hypothetical protein
VNTSTRGRRRRTGMASMCALVAVGLLAACGGTSPAGSPAGPSGSATVSGGATSFNDARLQKLKGDLDSLMTGIKTMGETR